MADRAQPLPPFHHAAPASYLASRLGPYRLTRTQTLLVDRLAIYVNLCGPLR